MQIYWWFLIPAFFLLIFSDRIDRAVKANRKLRKAMLVILALCSGLLLVSIMAVLTSRFAWTLTVGERKGTAACSAEMTEDFPPSSNCAASCHSRRDVIS